MEYIQQYGWMILLILICAEGLLLGCVYVFRRDYIGELWIPAILLGVSAIFWGMSGMFSSNDSGPRLIPRLYIVILVSLNLAVLGQIAWKKISIDVQAVRYKALLKPVGIFIAYIILIDIVGYFVSTFLFLITIMYSLSYRNHIAIWLTASGWLCVSYAVFYKVLYIQLPLGIIYEKFWG